MMEHVGVRRAQVSNDGLKGVLACIGGTPIIELSNILQPRQFRIFAKMEALNPGGSIKDRPAREIILAGIRAGQIRSDTVVIESSSGNMGIGLAQVCRYLQLRFICVIDPKATPRNRRLLETYGAEVELVTEPDPATGEFLQARLYRVKQLVGKFKNAFWPNQYSNLRNALAHEQTMHEIVAGMGSVDYLFCPASTCGTLRGCTDYIRKAGLRTKTIAVDAVGSVIFGGMAGKRLLPGHGASVRPDLYHCGIAERCVHVTDLDCVAGCRQLLSSEALLLGGSSGGALMAVKKIMHDIPPGANCAVIFPDRGERYLETIFCDSWVKEHLLAKPKELEENYVSR